jgi:hypothetical protein
MSFILRLLFSLSTEASRFMTIGSFCACWPQLVICTHKEGREKGEGANLRMFECLAQLEIFHFLVQLDNPRDESSSHGKAL